MTERRRRLLWGMASVSLALLAASFAFRKVENPDTPWHLAVGREILETGSIPEIDRLAVLSEGRPWIDVAWLAQLVMAVLEKAGGILLLQVATVAAALLALTAALACGAGARAAISAAPIAVVSLIAAHTRFDPRPDLSALVFPPLAILLLDRVGNPATARRPRSVTFVALGLLQILWSNVHGSFVLGPMIAAAYLAGAWLSSPGRFARRRLALGLVLVLGATLANPRGIHLWALFGPYLEAVAGRFGAAGAPAPPIQEWIPTFSAEASEYLVGVAGAYYVLLALTVIALFGAGRAMFHLPRALVLLLFAALSITAIRNIAAFALVALAIVPPFLDTSLGRLPPRATRWLSSGLVFGAAIAALMLTLQVTTNRYFAARLLPSELGPGWAETAFPEAAFGWVEAAGLEGQAFHSYEAGGYYLWRFDRRRKAFADGRLDLIAPDELERYRQAMQDPDRFEELAAPFGVTHVVLRYAGRDSAILFRYLETARERWTRAFLDGGGAVYLRAGTAPPPVEPSARPEHPWDRAARRLFGPLARRQVHFPTPLLNLAYFHEAAGDPREAVALYEQALRMVPAMAPSQLRLGFLYLSLGERERALEHLRWLERQAPREPGVEELRRALEG